MQHWMFSVVKWIFTPWTKSVKDGITVPIVYEGRAAKAVLNNSVLEDIEKYYDEDAEQGASEYQVDQSKREMAQMGIILGDPDRLKAVAADFVAHYEARIEEKSSVFGKVMFVCYNPKIKLLQMLLKKAIGQIRKVNKTKGVDFTKKSRLWLKHTMTALNKIS